MIGRGVAASAVALLGCTILNDPDVCEVRSQETRINERGDEVEHIGHSRAAAVLEDGRILVAFVSTSEAGDESEVRIALLNSGGTSRLTLCGGSDTETVLSPPDALAHSATVAAVQIPTGRGPTAAAAIGWTEGTLGNGTAVARIRLVDTSGCPLGPQAFPPVPDDVTGPATGLSLTWSRPKQALWATFHDGRRVLAAWIDAHGSASDAEVLATEEVVFGEVVAAVNDDGDGIVAWASAELATVAEQAFRVRALLVDAEGRPRPAVLGGGDARPFFTDADSSYRVEGQAALLGTAVAASPDRLAVSFEGAAEPGAPTRVWLRELDVRDGAPLSLAGAEGGQPLPVRLSDRGQLSPSVAYLPGGSLFVLWESSERSGTMGRVFRDNGDRQFTGLGCNEEPFAIGARTRIGAGTSTSVLDENRVWVFHAGQIETDPVATAVLGWRMTLSALLALDP